MKLEVLSVTEGVGVGRPGPGSSPKVGRLDQSSLGMMLPKGVCRSAELDGCAAKDFKLTCYGIATAAFISNDQAAADVGVAHRVNREGFDVEVQGSEGRVAGGAFQACETWPWAVTPRVTASGMVLTKGPARFMPPPPVICC